MLEFALPIAFALLPLPFVMRYFLPAAKTADQAALKVPGAESWANNQSGARGTSRWLSLLLGLIAWLLLVAAAARPQWLGEPQALPVSGRDLMLAVDVSGSMRLRDFRINNRTVTRLDATKVVASEFIARRNGDRVGLILFGRQAYLQTPLTFDRRTVAILLGESFIGIAGNETAIGDAIGLAIKRLRDKPTESRVLVLLTDGANTAGAIDPLRAASLAAREGLRVYTVGIGADQVTARSLFGISRQNPSSSLDEETLQAIADETGGRYFRARDTRELNDIYRELDRLEPAEFETEGFRPVRALFYWPLGGALLLGLITLLARYGLPAGRPA